MGNTPTKHMVPTLGAEFIPFEAFEAYAKNDNTPSHYQSTFSIALLIEELRAQSETMQKSTLQQTIATLEKAEAIFQNATESWETLCQLAEVEPLMSHIFPSFFFAEQLGFVKGPFERFFSFRFQTPAFQKLQEDDRNWEIKVDPHKIMTADRQIVLMSGTTVLNRFYNQEVNVFANEGMVLKDPDTQTEKHYRFDIQLDYLDVKLLKPLKKLSKKQIHQLLNNLYDKELWLKYIPPENFLFEGFVIGLMTDTTKQEILSVMKEMAANEGGKSDHEEDLNYLERLARSYLDMPELEFGALQTIYRPYVESLTWSLLREYDVIMVRQALADSQGAYGKVLHSEGPVVVEDLRKQAHLCALEKALLEKGLRSLLLAPLRDDEGKVVSILELGSAEPYRFSQLTLLQMEEFISLMEMGTNKFLAEMENAVSLTMQKEFTSIHPSVEWKFKEVASKCFWERTIEQQQSTPDDIVFKNVFPLYGQADIVSSSKQRNNSIQADLIDNLKRVHQVLLTCRKAVHFHLLDIYAEKVKAHADRLAQGTIASSDESVIVELLTLHIHPLLRQLRLRFPQLPQTMLDEYFDYLDADLDIVYRSRKAYEDSVTQLNAAISHHLLKEEEKMQKILPHYFEKFQTDGVEYNLYLGQSLLEDGEFHEFYLRDFRLWQLILMCEMTRLIRQEAKKMPVPLATAQLVFVFNNALSIRFEMDEKQFDVDGAYNIRYEIIKKRIDKAYIKGTNERLTQAGKIAIVWLQDKDRQEYQEYLDHLVLNGYIHPDIEDLELEKMQGVEGLKAMRVTVI
ncbi:MAG: GAF domain-containing protein [Bacteroidota bacterium]